MFLGPDHMATRTVIPEGYRGILSVVDANDTVRAGVRAIASLGPAVVGIEAAEVELADVHRAAERGHFTPDEDGRVHAWFARYLTARAGLLETIGDLRPVTDADVDADAETQLHAFVVAYTAACLLVRAGRFLSRSSRITASSSASSTRPSLVFGYHASSTRQFASR